MWVVGYTPIKIIMVFMAKKEALLVKGVVFGHQSLMFQKRVLSVKWMELHNNNNVQQINVVAQHSIIVNFFEITFHDATSSNPLK